MGNKLFTEICYIFIVVIVDYIKLKIILINYHIHLQVNGSHSGFDIMNGSRALNFYPDLLPQKIVILYGILLEMTLQFS